MLKAIRAILTAAAFFFAAPLLAKSQVVVLHGEESLRDAGERRFAKSLANHAVRWMKDGGVAADIAPDRDVPGALAGRKVAVLVHCDEPTARQIAAYKSFVARGGRLVVTYSSSQALASVVGVRVGKYKRDAKRAMMVFGQSRPRNSAAQIRQSSPNIVEAFPVPGRSSIIAWWADAAGKSDGDAAWLRGDGGYWMTHVLLADGDAAQKGTLLLALAGEVAPEIWREAARARLSASASTGSWKTEADARAAVGRLPHGPKRSNAVGELADAETARGAARSMLAAGRGADAWFFAREAGQHLDRAYGYAQSPRHGEIRAVWDHSGFGLYPGDWPRTCRELAAAGITDIFINSASAVSANCFLKTVPKSAACERFGDQLAACIAAARPCGIRVHAWLCCLTASGASQAQRERMGRDGWLVDNTAGGRQDWLDPSSAGVRSRIVSIATEIMQKYKIDGLHLDYVRYQDYYGSLGYGARTRFVRDNGGREIADWKSATKRQPLMGRVMRWRARQVTSLVAAVRTAQRRVAPGLELSAAVLGKYPTCVESVGQDWMAWLESGYIDYAMPMNYTESMERYSELLGTQLGKGSFARKIVGGIGVTASESRLGAGQVIDQIQALRRGGAAGFILFDLDATLSSEILPILSLGTTER